MGAGTTFELVVGRDGRHKKGNDGGGLHGLGVLLLLIGL
jgi:hypothetical protein